MKRIALIIALLLSVLAINAQNKFIDILPEMTVIDGELWVLTIDGPSGAAIWKKYKASVMKEYITPYPLPTTAGSDGQGIVFDTGTGAFIYADLTYQQDFLDSLAAIRADLPAAATTNTVHVIATLGDTTTIISPVEADIAWVSSDTIAFRDDAQWRVFLGGSSTVNTDGTITGDGSVGSPLGVDTSVIASFSALQDTAAAIRGDVVGGLSSVASDNTLTGNGTSGSPIKVDTSIIASSSALQDSAAAIRSAIPSTAGLMSNFTVIGNTGTNETIQNGDELEFRGRNGITTSNSATDIINIDADTSLLATVSALRDSSAAIRADFPAAGSTNFTVYDGVTSENATDADTLTFIWDEGITGAVGPKTGGQIDINVKFDGGEAAAETTPSNNNSFLMDDASQNRLEGITWPNLVASMRDSITTTSGAANETDILARKRNALTPTIAGQGNAKYWDLASVAARAGLDTIARVLFIGDSQTFADFRFTKPLRDSLAKFGLSGGPGFMSATTLNQYDVVEISQRSATYFDSLPAVKYGLDLNDIYLNTGDSIHMTLYDYNQAYWDTAWIAYRGHTGGGTMDIRINGTLAASVNTNTTEGLYFEKVSAASISNHTISIKSSLGGVQFCGIWAKSSSGGFQVNKAGRNGISANTYLAQMDSLIMKKWIDLIQPHSVVINLGVNNVNGVNPATQEASKNLQLYNRVKTFLPSADYWVFSPAKTENPSDQVRLLDSLMWVQYKELPVGWVSFYQLYAESYSIGDGFGMFQDSVHYSTIAGKRNGEFILKNIFLRDTQIPGKRASEIVGSGELGDLSNVTITSATTGDHLEYNGSTWINTPKDWTDHANGIYNTGNIGIGDQPQTNAKLAITNTNAAYNVTRWVNSSAQEVFVMNDKGEFKVTGRSPTSYTFDIDSGTNANVGIFRSTAPTLRITDSDNGTEMRFIVNNANHTIFASGASNFYINNSASFYPGIHITTGGGNRVRAIFNESTTTQGFEIFNNAASGSTGIRMYQGYSGHHDDALVINTTGTLRAVLNTTGLYLGDGDATARLHLPAGTASASTAPLKFTSGTNLTTPEAGAVEWDGTNLYVTQASGPTRKTIAYTTDIADAQQYAQSHNTGGENTSITAATPEQINGTTSGTITTIANTSEFTVQADGDIQYTGANNSVLEIEIDLSLTTGGAAQMYYYIAINGTVQTTSRTRHDHDGAGYEHVSIKWIDSDADTNDVYSVYAEPVTGTELTTISDMRIGARKIK